MKINKELEIDFIRAIQKRAINRTQLDENNLFKRNKSINEQFEWTSKVYQNLILLNEKLYQEERRIFSIYRKIENQCNKMVESQELDDFEIEIKLSCWNDKYYKKYEPSLDGNPFFVIESVTDFMSFQDKLEFVSHSFNETGVDSPLFKAIIAILFIICMTILI